MLIVQCIIYYRVHAMIGRKFFCANYLFSNTNRLCFRYGISPGGLASQSYSGAMFFDMDW